MHEWYSELFFSNNKPTSKEYVDKESQVKVRVDEVRLNRQKFGLFPVHPGSVDTSSGWV